MNECRINVFIIFVQGMVKAMSKSMSEALKIPHFGYYEEIEMSNLGEKIDL